MDDKDFSYPNPLASRAEKKTNAYGLAYAEFIYAQYYKVSPILNERTARFKNNLKHAEGLQSITDVRTFYKNNQGTSPLNLDVRPVNYISKIVDIIVSVLMEQPFTVECNAIDPQSKIIESEIKSRVYAAMHLKKVNDKFNIEGRTGISIVPKGQPIPETDEEAELFLELQGKVGLSLAMEEAIQYVLDNNDFDYEVKRKILRNLVACKGAAIMTDYDENYNITITAPEFYDVVYPYSKYDTFKNIPYVGLVTYMTIEEIALKAKKEDGSPRYTEKELVEIAKAYQGQNYNNPAWNGTWGMSYEGFYQNSTLIKPFYNFNIPVLRFWFLAVSQETLVKTSKLDKAGREKIYYDWKAKGASEDSTNIKQNIAVKEKEWRYEGYWIMGSKYLFNYKESDDIPREKIKGGYNPKTTLPIKIIAPDIYDMENKSIVEKAIPAEEQLNLIEQKIQQCVIEFRPKGYALNTAVLEEMKAGKGKDETLDPVALHDQFTQTGKILYYAVMQDGVTPANINPIQDLPNGFGEAFGELMNLRMMYMQQIRDVMGFSESMDTTMPSAEMPIGTQQMARQATMNSLMGTYKAAVNLLERGLQDVSLMIQDCIEKDRDGFIAAIGQTATSEIEMFKQLPLATIGVNIRIGSSEEEKAKLNEWIGLDVKNSLIDSGQAIEVQDALRQNVKLAKGLLRKFVAMNKKMAQDQQLQMVQANAQTQQQSAQVASQMKQQEVQLEIQGKGQLIQMEYSAKDMFAEKEFQRAYKLQQLKNLGSNTDSEIAAGGKVNVQEAANRAKIVSSQIEQNTQITKAHIVHHSDHSKIEHQKQADIELLEHEPPEKKEEKD